MNDKIDNLTKVFEITYSHNRWGSEESRSGVGSQLNYTSNIRSNLERIITSYNIKSIFDCSCGDWNWMKHVNLENVNYIGNDIVAELIEVNNKNYSSNNIKFINSDCVTSLKNLEDKSIDLVICRHTLEHLELDYCVEVCGQIKRVSKYALITSNNEKSQSVNSHLAADGFSSRQIDLQKQPFVDILGTPTERFYDTINPNNTDVFNGMNFYYFNLG